MSKSFDPVAPTRSSARIFHGTAGAGKRGRGGKKGGKKGRGRKAARRGGRRGGGRR